VVIALAPQNAAQAGCRARLRTCRPPGRTRRRSLRAKTPTLHCILRAMSSSKSQRLPRNLLRPSQGNARPLPSCLWTPIISATPSKELRYTSARYRAIASWTPTRVHQIANGQAGPIRQQRNLQTAANPIAAPSPIRPKRRPCRRRPFHCLRPRPSNPLCTHRPYRGWLLLLHNPWRKCPAQCARTKRNRTGRRDPLGLAWSGGPSLKRKQQRQKITLA
jgi:hypothetical protein